MASGELTPKSFTLCAATHAPALQAGRTHLWLASLNLPPARLCQLHSLLSPVERQRAERFRFECDRRRSIASRALLRVLTGSYLGRSPAELDLAYGPAQKPWLTAHPGFHFNVSHADDLAVFAFSLAGEVGVDIECTEKATDVLALAARHFSSRERAALSALPSAQQVPAFFACWTRKEAVLKAKGCGLSLPLSSFDVSLAPEQPAELLHSEDPADHGRWRLSSFVPREGFVGALCVERPGAVAAFRLAQCELVPPSRSEQRQFLIETQPVLRKSSRTRTFS